MLPAQTIRTFLDQNGGQTEATVDNLLVTFGVPSDARTGRQRIADELSDLGVEVDRPLGSLAPDDVVHLSLAAPTVDLDAELGRFVRGNGHANGHTGTNGHGNGHAGAPQAATPPPPAYSPPPPAYQPPQPAPSRFNGWWIGALAAVLLLAAVAGGVALVVAQNDGTASAHLAIQTDSFSTTHRFATVRGTVSPADATVEVAGVTATTSGSSWTARVPLDYGENQISVRATKQGVEDATANTVVVRRHRRGASSQSTPPASSAPAAPSRTSCGDGLSVGPNTTCAFAEQVRSSYPGSSDSFDAYSPVTGETYSMSCTTTSPHECHGGNNASVYFTDSPAASSSSSASCEPGYSPCLEPGAGDYDCAGGSGDGPNYADGPVTVTGSDPFDLDRDGDGVGCDS